MLRLLANAGCQLRRWQAFRPWRTWGRGSCQAMRVRPTRGAPSIWVAGSVWRLGIARLPTGRSALPGESRPAHRPRQRRQLHSVVRVRFWKNFRITECNLWDRYVRGRLYSILYISTNPFYYFWSFFNISYRSTGISNYIITKFSARFVHKLSGK